MEHASVLECVKAKFAVRAPVRLWCWEHFTANMIKLILRAGSEQMK